jgi:hypothetical protein
VTKSSCSTAADAAAATPAGILRVAAAYLTEHGWIQGEAFANHTSADQPPGCVYGAIRIACGSHPSRYLTKEQDAAIDRAMHALAYHLQPVDRDVDGMHRLAVYPIVTGWNDDPHTTAEQVIAALRAAANAWDRRHPADVVPRNVLRGAA